MDKKTGSCLCGDVQFDITGDLRDSVACHCNQCRKTSGHFVSATAVSRDEFNITVDKGLKWYRSSARARRGFCNNCGSSLFWDQEGRDKMGIMSGTIDGETGIKTSNHIYVAKKGDYYDLDDELPKHRTYPQK